MTVIGSTLLPVQQVDILECCDRWQQIVNSTTKRYETSETISESPNTNRTLICLENLDEKFETIAGRLELLEKSNDMATALARNSTTSLLEMRQLVTEGEKTEKYFMLCVCSTQEHHILQHVLNFHYESVVSFLGR